MTPALRIHLSGGWAQVPSCEKTPCILLQDDMEGSGNVFWSTARGADGLQVSAGAELGQLGGGASWGQGVPGAGLW